MDNFYTATVYSKGAEVIRMYNTLLGTDGFRKGMDLYFERHDGTGVTCDDFLAAMADANGVDLSQFSLWYSTSGTPTVKYSSSFESGVFSLTLEQSSNSDKPLHIPVSVGLVDKESGEEVVPTTVLSLKEGKQTFEFPGLKGDVVASILRDFSAPVKLIPASGEVDESALAFLAAEDTDGFNRWEATQRLYTSLILQTMDGKESDTTLQYVFSSFERTLTGKKLSDYSIQAYALMLPTEGTLSEEVEIIDPTAIHEARGSVKETIARKFQTELEAKYHELSRLVEAESELKVDAKSIGLRRLRNVMLEYLCSIKTSPEEQKAAAVLAKKHFENASGMTDKMAALNALASMDGEGAENRDWALQKFYEDAGGYALSLDKWFSVQALANLPDALDRVKALTKHPDFTLEVPNRCRSLVSVFTMNAPAFHNPSGEGYKFIGEMLVELDKLNPQVSSRLASSLIRWRKYDENLGSKMKAELEKLKAMKPISEDLYEIVSKALD
jgi:aminopeptidase N